ncbi:hypothetical protein D3C81_2137570 [compost metagenome]
MMLCGAPSAASTLTMPTAAIFAAAYAANPFCTYCGYSARSEVVSTMRPWPCACIAGQAAWASHSGALAATAIMWSKRSSSTASIR